MDLYIRCSARGCGGGGGGGGGGISKVHAYNRMIETELIECSWNDNECSGTAIRSIVQGSLSSSDASVSNSKHPTT